MDVVMAERVAVPCDVCPLFGVANTLLCVDLEATVLVLGVPAELCLGLLMDGVLNPTLGVVWAFCDGVLNRLLLAIPCDVVATERE